MDIAITEIGASQGPFGNYIKIIGDIQESNDKIIEINGEANYCKNVSHILMERVTNANNYVKELEFHKEENGGFLAKPGTLQKFIDLRDIIAQIVDFVKRSSQIEGLASFESNEEIQQQFTELIGKFDKYSEELKFVSQITIDDNFVLKHDLAEIDKVNMVDENGRILQKIPLIVQLTKEFNELLINNRTDIIHPLTTTKSLDNLKDETFEIIGYRMVPDKTRGQHIRKWSKVSDPNKVIAVKEVNMNVHPDTSMEQIKKQIEILKMLRSLPQVIKFYGTFISNSKLHIVTEWAHNDNLRNYYIKNPRLGWNKKSEFSIDICRGLIYLHSMHILHHDIRSANILITLDNKAKIANFGISRGFNEATRNHNETIDTIRYMAPEKLDSRNYKYDNYCEIFSFGMLLWEIAEEKMPYEKEDNIKKLADIIVKKKVREGFVTEVPPEWKKIFKETTRSDPRKRSKLSKIVEDLSKVYEIFHPRLNTDDRDTSEYESQLIIDQPLSESELSLEDAIKEHHKDNGDKAKSFKSFINFANSGNPEAKYWAGLYLYHNILRHNQPIDDTEKRFRACRAATFFKESADECNTPNLQSYVDKAQLHFAYCLWNGQGIDKNYIKAIEYFKKAALNGNPYAMYNYGKILYDGIYVPADKGQGEMYLKLAAEQKVQEAIAMCNTESITYR
ncbi:15467_t:CDS:2 [Dentiscutata heterogama]|uniref:15467_t:CDS:1 n=1 Tax=Dentiscutata heterogama TaxID=1316150 RepID=A0ACA9JZU1_9GLOM|nr:15467_t:CDS:2 [Dentiscutata heterogama]